MQPEEMRALLRARPFQPLRVRLTDQRTFDILYPHLALVTRPLFILGLADPASGGEWAIDSVRLPWSSIRDVEVAPVASAGGPG
jgi:hypothetical protein